MSITSDDRQYLDTHYCGQWKLTDDRRGLLICDYPLPEGYTVAKVRLMILIPQGYPIAALDMFYLDPPVSRKDGVGLGALESESHFDQSWQRWSRHYEWKPEEDHCLATHLQIVENTLRKEAQ